MTEDPAVNLIIAIIITSLFVYLASIRGIIIQNVALECTTYRVLISPKPCCFIGWDILHSTH